MTKSVNTTLDFGGVGGIIGLPDATVPQSPATLAQVNALVEGLAWKDNVVVATQANISVASPGATVDGITMVAGDRMLLRAQTAQPENGLYIWNGAAVAATRAVDGTDVPELRNAVTTVDQGTSAGVSYRQSTITGAIGTANIVWTTFGSATPVASTTQTGTVTIATQAEVDTGTDTLKSITPATLKASANIPKRFQVTFGDGSATQYTITHNLNTRDVLTSIKQTASPWQEIICDVEATTVNTITARFASAPALNSMRAIVMA